MLVRLSILGNPQVGKSALTLRYIKNSFVSFYEPTIEEEYERQEDVRGMSVDVILLDTAGQEEYLPLRNKWIGDRDGFVFAVESLNPDIPTLEK